MRNIYDFTLKELEDYFVSIGDKKFRAVQVYDFLYKKRICDIAKMTNISKDMREHLDKNFSFSILFISFQIFYRIFKFFYFNYF